jgi:hypothetical protein
LQLPAPSRRQPAGYARWYRQRWQPLEDWAAAAGARVMLAWCRVAAPALYQLGLQGSGRQRRWLASSRWPDEDWLQQVFERLLDAEAAPLLVCLKGLDLSRAHQLAQWLVSREQQIRLVPLPADVDLTRI